MGDRFRRELVYYDDTHVRLMDCSNLLPRMVSVTLPYGADPKWYHAMVGAVTEPKYKAWFSTVIEPYGVGEHLLRNRSFGK